MRVTRISATFAIALAFAACSSNYSFADVRRADGMPDVTRLDQALAASAPNDLGQRELSETTWFPLIAMNVHSYKASPAGMLPGNTLASKAGHGPLFMNGSSDEWRYDTKGSVYERRTASYAVWGLFQQEGLEVRVPTGWRVGSKVSLLFGLLEWPSEGYPRGENPPSVTQRR